MKEAQKRPYLETRIEEVTEQIELATDPDWVAWGLITRADLHKENGDIPAALEDLATAVDLAGIPVRKLEKALRKRSFILQCAQQYELALMDIERILATPGMPPDCTGGARLQYGEIFRVARSAGIVLDANLLRDALEGRFPHDAKAAKH